MTDRTQPGWDDPGRRARTNNEITLYPGQYIYIQDTVNGGIKVHCGPCTVNTQGQERAAKFHPQEPLTSTHRFTPVSVLGEAVCQNVVVPEGHYCVLINPAMDGSHPQKTATSPGLKVGQRINIQGPAEFPLWPGQVAEVIKGHVLRTNNYLFAEVIDEKAARKNWADVTLIKATPAASEGAEGEAESESSEAPATVAVEEIAGADLRMGQVILIRGDQVSFFIPPTGLRVQAEKDSHGRVKRGREDQPVYVRDACTLRSLEYAILQDETGDKRFPRGPAVVFPTPTETFVEGTTSTGDSSRVYRAIELQEHHGIHIRVIADYTDADGTTVKRGEELFLRGDKTPIYFPREEHKIITYGSGGQTEQIHFATLVPKGNGRYVLNRQTGEVNLVQGPRMLLPDPRNEVIVRRVLDDSLCKALYPGNSQALDFNRHLRNIADGPGNRDAAVSEAAILAATEANYRGGSPKAAMLSGTLERARGGYAQASDLEAAANLGGDELIKRRSTYTEPRQLTLDTKYMGVPVIRLFKNYAILIVDAEGKRRVEVGPKTILLGFDERVETMELSTGTPKSDDNFVYPAYLKVRDNKVSDRINVTTRDHVRVTVRISNRLNFEGDDQERWFNVQNYVKHLAEHVRSLLKARVRSVGIAEFYAAGEVFVRDTILGKRIQTGSPAIPAIEPVEGRPYQPAIEAVEGRPEILAKDAVLDEDGNVIEPAVEYQPAIEAIEGRPEILAIEAVEGRPEVPAVEGVWGRVGLVFPENAMRVYDVEVLDVSIQDREIQSQLQAAQFDAVTKTIEIENSRRDLETTKEQNEIEKERLHSLDAVSKLRTELALLKINRDLQIALDKAKSRIEEEAKNLDLQKATDAVLAASAVAANERTRAAQAVELAHRKAQDELAKAMIEAETAAQVARLNAASGGFSEALLAVNSQNALVAISQAMSVQEQFLGGSSVQEAMSAIFSGTPLEAIAKTAIAKAAIPSNGVATHA